MWGFGLVIGFVGHFNPLTAAAATVELARPEISVRITKYFFF
jgi:hypothetical protein